ncbi:MAG: hypothetical protein RPU12_14790 [Candidatus Sedimenticola sp. (ex Thyasira tokunagai)]
MARIRTIKPEFWQDEDLAELQDVVQLLAIGLLNHADDEGYFKAHSMLIKAVIFPLRVSSLNIQGMLTELSNIDYIRLFTGSDGKEYGLVTNFKKHQVVNRPTPSKIKELEDVTEGSLSAHGGLTAGREGKGRERNREQGKDMERDLPPSGDCPANAEPSELKVKQKPKNPPCPHQDIIDLYHEILPTCRSVKTWTNGRRGNLRARWNAKKTRQTLDYWRRLFVYINKSPFLTGQTDGREGKPPFRLDLGWIVKEANFTNIEEGKYHNEGGAS